MVTREDIQSWLERLESGNLEVREMQPGMWLAKTPEGAEVVVSLAAPVVILRVRVMELPASKASMSCSPTPSSWLIWTSWSSRRAGIR